MSFYTRENLRRANHLHEHARRSQIDFDCLPVSLLALGATEIEFADLLNSEFKKPSLLEDVLERNGLKINWQLPLQAGTAPEILEYLLDRAAGNDLPQQYPGGTLAGFLLIDHYPWETDRPFHVVAILPRDQMPRDMRRFLKQKQAYTVVDTSSDGELKVTTRQLAHHTNQVCTAGGQVLLFQIKRHKR